MSVIEDVAVAHKLASRSNGLVATRDLIASGVDKNVITLMIQHGVLVHVRRGVYRLAGVDARDQDPLHAAVLSCAGSSAAFASHVSSVWLFGLAWPETLSRVSPPEPHHVTVILERLPRPDGVTVHRSGRLHSDVTWMRDVPCTTAERTIVDVSNSLSIEDLGLLIDSALRQRLTTVFRIGRCSERLGRSPGRSPQKVAAALQKRTDGAEVNETVLEEFVYDSIVKFGLPRPTPQHWVVVDGKPYRIDHCYPQDKYAIEVQSHTWHGQYSDDFRDALKGNDLGIAKFKLLYFTAEHTDWQIAETVARALDRPVPPRPGREQTFAEWKRLHRI